MIEIRYFGGRKFQVQAVKQPYSLLLLLFLRLHRNPVNLGRDGRLRLLCILQNMKRQKGKIGHSRVIIIFSGTFIHKKYEFWTLKAVSLNKCVCGSATYQIKPSWDKFLSKKTLKMSSEAKVSHRQMLYCCYFEREVHYGTPAILEYMVTLLVQSHKC